MAAHSRLHALLPSSMWRFCSNRFNRIWKDILSIHYWILMTVLCVYVAETCLHSTGLSLANHGDYFPKQSSGGSSATDYVQNFEHIWAIFPAMEIPPPNMKNYGAKLVLSIIPSEEHQRHSVCDKYWRICSIFLIVYFNTHDHSTSAHVYFFAPHPALSIVGHLIQAPKKMFHLFFNPPQHEFLLLHPWKCIYVFAKMSAHTVRLVPRKVSLLLSSNP